MLNTISSGNGLLQTRSKPKPLRNEEIRTFQNINSGVSGSEGDVGSYVFKSSDAEIQIKAILVIQLQWHFPDVRFHWMELGGKL